MNSIKLSFIILFLFVGQVNAQTAIDIIRASNFYSKAVESYDRGSYSTALKHLEDAEVNLKGNTNRDLEYLKIMTSYHLKDYRTAYDLVQIYFEEGYKERTESFRNIERYNQKHAISYSEELTAIFVELEQKYSLVANTSHEDVIANIVKRIKKEKRLLRDFIHAVTPSGKRSSVRVYEPSYYGDKGKTYRYSFNFIRQTESRHGKFKDHVYYNENGGCTVQVKFKESKTRVNKYSYRYGFEKSSQFGFTECSKARQKSEVDYHLKDKLEEINFVKNNSKTYTIDLTDDETLILEQGDNLKKLKAALNREGLL